MKGTLDERGVATIPNAPDLPAKLEYGLDEEAIKEFQSGIGSIYQKFSFAVTDAAEALGRHMLAVARSQPEPPKDVKEAVRIVIENKLAELKAEDEAYKNLTYLGQATANLRALGGGMATGVTEYIPDLGEFGDLLDSAEIDITDVMNAIVTGNDVAIRELESKFSAWTDRGNKGLEKATYAMEVLILLLSDSTTRDLLASLPVRMIELMPPDQLIEITAAQATQMGMDATIIGAGTAAGTLAGGVGGVVAAGALTTAAGARKGGSILDNLLDLLMEIAEKLKPMVAHHYGDVGALKPKTVLKFGEDSRKHGEKVKASAATNVIKLRD